MAQSSSVSSSVSIKMTPGKAKQVAAAVETIRTRYGPLLDMWQTLSEEQRRAVLAHSPVLARLLAGVVV